MTKFCVVWGMRTTTTNFSYFHLELNAVTAYLARARFENNWPTLMNISENCESQW